MCITGYWHVRNLKKDQIVDLDENLDFCQSVKKLKALAGELNIMIGAGLIEIAKDNNLYNTYIVFSPDGKIFSHRKFHLLSDEYTNLRRDLIDMKKTSHELRPGDPWNMIALLEGWR